MNVFLSLQIAYNVVMGYILLKLIYRLLILLSTKYILPTYLNNHVKTNPIWVLTSWIIKLKNLQEHWLKT
jgi:hypothetical protein